MGLLLTLLILKGNVKYLQRTKELLKQLLKKAVLLSAAGHLLDLEPSLLDGVLLRPCHAEAGYWGRSEQKRKSADFSFEYF